MNTMMGNQSDRPKEVLRWLLPVLVLSLLGGVLVYAKDEVDRRVARAGGAWSIDQGNLALLVPAWFQGRTGDLAFDTLTGVAAIGPLARSGSCRTAKKSVDLPGPASRTNCRWSWISR